MARKPYFLKAEAESENPTQGGRADRPVNLTESVQKAQIGLHIEKVLVEKRNRLVFAQAVIICLAPQASHTKCPLTALPPLPLRPHNSSTAEHTATTTVSHGRSFGSGAPSIIIKCEMGKIPTAAAATKTAPTPHESHRRL